MKHFYKLLTPVILVLFVSACSGGGLFNRGPKPDPKPVLLPEKPTAQQLPGAGSKPGIGTAGVSADALDKASEAEKKAATQGASIAPSRSLGKTTVSLGDPAQSGFWLKTGLVKSTTEGRVESASGKSVNVTLIPISGADAGSRMSISALRALGIGLTDLATVTVFSR